MLRRGYSDFINFILPPKLSPNMQRHLIPIAHHDKGGAGQIHITYSYALQFPGKGRRILCRQTPHRFHAQNVFSCHLGYLVLLLQQLHAVKKSKHSGTHGKNADSGSQ